MSTSTFFFLGFDGLLSAEESAAERVNGAAAVLTIIFGDSQSCIKYFK
jgi:hypothetical protein